MSVSGELHKVNVSPNCFQINAFIDHFKLSNVTKVDVAFDPQSGLNTKTHEFLEMNPHHTIPTFKSSEGWTMWESTAVLRHLARASGNESLLGTSDEDKAKVDMMLFWRADNFMKHAQVLVLPKLGLGKPPSADEEAIARKALTESFAILESSGFMIKGDSFVCGTNYLTIADFQIWSGLVFLQSSKQYDLPDITKRYLERLEEKIPVLKENRVDFDGWCSMMNL